MSASEVVNSFYGHMFKNSRPDNVLANVDRAIEKDKSINLASGRFVHNNRNTYWYYSHYPFAIPIGLATSQGEANLIFDEYVDRIYNTTINTNETNNLNTNNYADDYESDFDDDYETDFIDDGDQSESIHTITDDDYVDE